MRKYLLTQFFVKKILAEDCCRKSGTVEKNIPIACSRLVLKSKDWGLRPRL